MREIASAATAESPVRPVLEDLESLLLRLDWTLLGFAQTAVAAGRSTAVPAGSVRFHYVVSGSVEIAGCALPVRLTAGDFLMLPRAGAHRVTASEDAVVASGELAAASTSGQPFTLALPESFGACGFVVREPSMGPLIQTLGIEFGRMRTGNCLMASRIATIIASAAVRSWVENGCAPDQWLVSVRDPHIARAVAAMREAPGEPWTVERLARVASASRTVFAERFRELVGDSPNRYLTTVRMEHAARLLRDGRLSVADVASRLGYSSDVAFSRAFRRHTGESPATWRRETAGATAISA
ncbi:MAG: AraC family transcriptional regulator [Leifsonia sp.]